MSCSDCSDMHAFVSEFVDGMLDEFDCETTQAQLAEHVRCCPDCQELEQAERLFRALVAERCHEVAPTELRLRITRMIKVGNVQFYHR